MKRFFIFTVLATMSFAAPAFADTHLGSTEVFAPGRHEHFTVSAGNQIFQELNFVVVGRSQTTHLWISKIVVNYANGTHQILRDTDHRVDLDPIDGYRHYKVQPWPIESVTIEGMAIIGGPVGQGQSGYYVSVHGL